MSRQTSGLGRSKLNLKCKILLGCNNLFLAGTQAMSQQSGRQCQRWESTFLMIPQSTWPAQASVETYFTNLAAHVLEVRKV